MPTRFGIIGDLEDLAFELFPRFGCSQGLPPDEDFEGLLGETSKGDSSLPVREGDDGNVITQMALVKGPSWATNNNLPVSGGTSIPLTENQAKPSIGKRNGFFMFPGFGDVDRGEVELMIIVMNLPS